MHGKYVKILISVILLILLSLLVRQTRVYQEFFSRVYNQIGYFYFQDWRYDKAIKEYKKALAYKDYSHKEYTCYNLANAYLAQKEYKKALFYYKKTLVYKPGFSEAEEQVKFIQGFIDKL
jgi:tetratricopeptide (TPR) repeat protein